MQQNANRGKELNVVLRVEENENGEKLREAKNLKLKASFCL